MFEPDDASEYLKNLPPDKQQLLLDDIDLAPAEMETLFRLRRRRGFPQTIDGDLNVKEALGFLKDWVTALIAIDTAAIGALAAFLPVIRRYHWWERGLLGLTLLCLGFSLRCGCNVLSMLPGCAQRKPHPKQDVYSLRTLDRSLGFWASLFGGGFMASVGCILTFYA